MGPIPPISGLYAVTPELEDDADLFDRVGSALRGGTRFVQYRDKGRGDERSLVRARRLLQLCHGQNARLIINDSVDLCRRVGADGVHLGRDDGAVGAARAVLGQDVMIGVSCYNEFERALRAEEAGADYIAFGSVFVSSVKPQAVRAPLELFRRARRELRLRLVAIGGIDTHNAREVIAAGAHAVAVISDLFEAQDIEARAREFCALFPSVNSSQ